MKTSQSLFIITITTLTITIFHAQTTPKEAVMSARGDLERYRQVSAMRFQDCSLFGYCLAADGI